MMSRLQRFLPALVVTLVLFAVPSAASPSEANPPVASEHAVSIEPGWLRLRPTPFVRLESRVPVTCEDLASSSELSAAIGLPAPLISAYNSEFPQIWDAAEIQSGALVCAWRGPSRGWTVGPQSHGIGPASVSIVVQPDAGTEFHAYSRFLNSPQWSEYDVPVVDGLAGPDSWSSCRVDELDRTCYGEFESLGYWVDYSFNGAVHSKDGDSTDPTPALSFAWSIQDALRDGGAPKARYSVPHDSLGRWESCSAIDDGGTMRAIVGSPLLLPPPDFTEYELQPKERFAAALASVDFAECGWNVPTEYSDGGDPSQIPAGQIVQLSVSVLPGGEWAWKEVHASTLAISTRSGGASADIVLPDGVPALLECFLGTACQVDALVDHSLVSVRYQYGYREPSSEANEAGVAQGIEFMPELIEQLRKHSVPSM